MAIIKCNCEHESQDKLHGKGWRVHNPTCQPKGAKPGEGYWRCTVCRKEKPNSSPRKES